MAYQERNKAKSQITGKRETPGLGLKDQRSGGQKLGWGKGSCKPGSWDAASDWPRLH